MVCLSVKETATRLDVDPATITRWIASGHLPGAFKLNPFSRNSPFRVTESDVIRLEKQRAQKKLA